MPIVRHNFGSWICLCSSIQSSIINWALRRQSHNSRFAEVRWFSVDCIRRSDDFHPEKHSIGNIGFEKGNTHFRQDTKLKNITDFYAFLSVLCVSWVDDFKWEMYARALSAQHVIIAIIPGQFPSRNMINWDEIKFPAKTALQCRSISKPAYSNLHQTMHCLV